MDCWGTFMMTGSVRDYLDYKEQERRENWSADQRMHEKEWRGEMGHEPERDSYRNGVGGNADW